MTVHSWGTCLKNKITTYENQNTRLYTVKSLGKSNTLHNRNSASEIKRKTTWYLQISHTSGTKNSQAIVAWIHGGIHAHWRLTIMRWWTTAVEDETWFEVHVEGGLSGADLGSGYTSGTARRCSAGGSSKGWFSLLPPRSSSRRKIEVRSRRGWTRPHCCW